MPSALKELFSQNTSYLSNILILFAFNGSLTPFASALHSQKTKSPEASSHMQMHLTPLSGAKKGFHPGLFIEVTLLSPSPQPVHQPPAACDSHRVLELLLTSAAPVWTLTTHTGKGDALFWGRQRHSPQLPKRPPLPKASLRKKQQAGGKQLMDFNQPQNKQF